MDTDTTRALTVAYSFIGTDGERTYCKTTMGQEELDNLLDLVACADAMDYHINGIGAVR